MHTGIYKWLVYIEYGETPQLYVNTLHGIAVKGGAEMVRVRTDVRPGLSLSDPNQAFEFSGYQDGLNHVVEQTKAAALQVGKRFLDARMEVVFVNDTFFYGHPRIVAKALLRRLLTPTAEDESSMVGMKMVANSAVQDLTGLDAYISTWAFKLSGPLSCVEQVQFFDPMLSSENFHEELYSCLPKNYLIHIEDWLAPKKFLRGWYKAVPGKALPVDTRRRKEMTIYLEHTLSARLMRLGFQQLDASQMGDSLSPTRMRVLKVIDKMFVNVLKLRTRLVYIFR